MKYKTTQYITRTINTATLILTLAALISGSFKILFITLLSYVILYPWVKLALLKSVKTENKE